MKAKELAELLDGVNPEADVRIDLGACNDKKFHLIYDLLIFGDEFMDADVESIEISFVGNDPTVYLKPYSGEYYGEGDKKIEDFFKSHNLGMYYSRYE